MPFALERAVYSIALLFASRVSISSITVDNSIAAGPDHVALVFLLESIYFRIEFLFRIFRLYFVNKGCSEESAPCITSGCNTFFVQHDISIPQAPAMTARVVDAKYL